MEKTVTLITPTGGRPQALELCKHYMREQTYKGDVQWIVIHDEEVDSSLEYEIGQNFLVEHIQAPKMWKPGINTQRPNLDCCLPLIRGEYVLFIEDDDWYHPNYIANIVGLLRTFPIVGELNAKYYNIKYKCFKEMENYEHSSLCQTAFRIEYLDLIEEAINSGELYIDLVLWRKIRERKIPHLTFSNINLCIGIKGMPGREGIGVGHKPQGFIPDATGQQLKNWVGQDAEKYKDFLGLGFKRKVLEAVPQVSPSQIWTPESGKSQLIY